MPKQAHTPEPWHATGGLVTTGKVAHVKQQDGIWIAECPPFNDEPNGHGHAIARTNADRIVACVNACVGLTNEQLAGMNVALHIGALEDGRDAAVNVLTSDNDLRRILAERKNQP